MDANRRMELVNEILEFLNEERIRCTYGAVGEILEVPARSVSMYLGERRTAASWVVSKANGKPTGYKDYQRHPDLCRKKYVIRSGTELMNELVAWKARRS